MISNVHHYSFSFLPLRGEVNPANLSDSGVKSRNRKFEMRFVVSSAFRVFEQVTRRDMA